MEVIFIPKNNCDILVMYAPIPESVTIGQLVPQERDHEVSACKSEKVKREKYSVWKLLEKAVNKRFNLDFDNLKFTKTDRGKWICDSLHFSLSHTCGAMCVAVSSSPVGVDIERVRDIGDGVIQRFLTENEYARAVQLSQSERARFFTECWVKKESLFKKDGGRSLMPRCIDTLGANVVLKNVKVGDGEYLIALAADSSEKFELMYTEEL